MTSRIGNDFVAKPFDQYLWNVEYRDPNKNA